jgi:hypothetical protein
MEAHNQIILLQLYTDPLITLTSHIKEPRTIPDISDLLVLMQVLVEERLDFLLVDIAHLLWRNSDHVAVLVTSV